MGGFVRLWPFSSAGAAATPRVGKVDTRACVREISARLKRARAFFRGDEGATAPPNMWSPPLGDSVVPPATH